MGFLDSVANIWNAERANQANAKEAQKNRDWQERMSNTAHQREIADLKAAGLNPILSSGGQGATTGAGAQAQMQQSNISGLDETIINSANTVKDWKLGESQKDVNESIINKNNAEADFTKGVGTKAEEKKIEHMQSNIAFNSAKTAEAQSKTGLIKAQQDLTSAQKVATKGNGAYIAGAGIEAAERTIKSAKDTIREEKKKEKPITNPKDIDFLGV